jgi:EAL domain-containing protein (putative c-di-GMP-specific phosphodiesterase class I)
VSRIGANRFAVVMETMRGKSEEGRLVQEASQRYFGKPYQVNGIELRLSVKTGITVFPNDGTDAESLIRNAEVAIRHAKKTGERFVFYSRAFTDRTAEELTLENSLMLALERKEFVLHYQPKVDLRTRGIVGVEALIRWQSPELGLVLPEQFISLMEETGIILDAGAWVLSQAAADHLRWSESGLPAPRVAVNVSAIQLRNSDFVDTVKDATRLGTNPPGIDLEITESLVMEDIESNIRKLNDVRGLGLSIAIDDFGTGYSSLGYLAKLPVETLKIDRSFIITMLDDPDTLTLVSTIISLAHSLKLRVVAEGVESEDQAAMLLRLQCDEAQGYLFSHPIPFEVMTALLAKQE